LLNSEDRSRIYQIDLDSTETNDARIIAYNYIKPHSTILDVGCACGDFGALVSTEKKCTVFGMEFDIKSIEEANKKCVFKRVHQVDLNALKTEEYQEYHNFFDYITLLDVLEHTVHPAQSLSSLKPYIKQDGFFIVSLPNVSFGDIKVGLLQNDFTYTDMGVLDKTHLKFFTYKTIAIFFAELGFEITGRQAKVSDITTKGTPYCVKNFIKRDPHSYAYQYVMNVRVSNLEIGALTKLNQDKMILRWPDIKNELNLIRRRKWINTLLPEGSTGRKIAKSIYEKITKRSS